MGTRTAGRALTVAALAATVVGAGGGSTAGAAPAVGPPPSLSSATTLLGAGLDRVTSLTVTAEKGSAPTLSFELFLTGYDCTVDVTGAQLALRSLETASARGVFGYSCEPDGVGQGFAAEAVSGKAVVDLTWTGTGEVRRATPDHCVGPYRVRSVAVSGSLVLTGGVEHAFPAPAADDSQLSFVHVVCPPGIP